MDDKQAQFLRTLEAFIEATEAARQFKGKAQVIRALKRIRNLSCFQ